MEEIIPNWLSAVMSENQAEYEQFFQKVLAKQQEFVQWMQASHGELMQKIMRQIAMAHTHNNTSTSNMMKETHKRDNMTHDASAIMPIDSKGHSSRYMENPRNFVVEKAEIDEGPTSTPLRDTPLFGVHTGSSRSTCIGSASTGIASSQSVGLSCMPAIGSSFAPVRGISTFGQNPSFREFGSPSPAQISLSGSSFSETGSAFVSQPFGTISTSACGSTLTPVFGTRTPIFGAMNALAYGFPSTPDTRVSNNPAIGINSNLSVGQSNASFSQPTAAFSGTPIPKFGSSPAFSSTASPFGSESSALGDQSITSIFSSLRFGQTPFGRPCGSCSLASYTSTYEIVSGVSGQEPGKLISISAMPQYGDKSHEELRWEDYQLGNKGTSTFGKKSSSGGFGSPTPTQSSSSRSTFGQTEPAFGVFTQPAFGAASTSAFGSISTPAFGSTLTPAFGTTTTSLGLTNLPTFGAPSTSATKASIISTPSFGLSATAFGETSATTIGNSPPRSTSCQAELAFRTQPFGVAVQPAFSATSLPANSSTFIPAFGTPTTSFGAKNVPAFGAPSTLASEAFHSFGFCSTPGFGLSDTAFGAVSAPTSGCSSMFGGPSCSSMFGGNASPSGFQGSALGAQSTSAFISEGFGRIHSGRLHGSGLTSYATTYEKDFALCGQTWKTCFHFCHATI